MLLLVLAAHAESPVLLPDARFALALYCAPTCADSVMDGLDTDLASIESLEGFTDFQGKPARIMGIAGTDFGMPDDDFLASYGHDVDRPEELKKSQQVLIAWFAGPRADAVDTFAQAHAAFLRAAKASKGWVEDLDTQNVYGAAAWGKLDPRGDLDDWYVIDGEPMDDAQPDGKLRLLTRGLRRWGNLELVVEDVDPARTDDVSTVLAAVAREIERKGDVAAAMKIDGDGVKGTAMLKVLESPREDDPQPPLIQVKFEGELVDDTPPADEPAPQVASVAEPPSLALPANTPPAPAPIGAPKNLDEARAQVRQQLAGRLKTAWQAGLAKGDVLALNVPFPTPKGSKEYLWLEVDSWNGETLTGKLATAPSAVAGLKKGDKVSVRQDDVFDYVWKHADGSREGSLTKNFLP